MVFLNADGSKTAYIYDYPVKYIDNDGKIKDISLDIKNSKTAGSFETKANSIVSTFSKNVYEGIRLEGNGESLLLVPNIPQNDSLSSGKASTETEKLTEASIAKNINNKKVSYKYDEKTTIEYSLTYTGFKEDIIVSEYTGQTEYDFTLYTNGLKLANDNGSFCLKDETNTTKAILGEIIIFTADERNNTLGEMKSETIKENEEYKLTIVVDPDFLSNPKTMYPIRIDPTLEICYDNNGAGAISDVTINSNSGSNGATNTVFIGLRQNYGISRLLMKFPGLDLSEIVGTADITNATVEIRDVMCEADELTIYCYPFTGNAWDESTVTWANVNPGSFSTRLSSNAISYTNGRAQEELYRYKFDITAAVVGWKSGTYNQNKGIIFKASNAFENGTTYMHKTFASYNYTAYRPSLSITYSEYSNFVSDGTYYINNTYCGEYLRYTSSGATPKAGLIASLGDTIRWEIIGVTGGYVIRSKSDPTKYLGVPTDTSSINVSLVTLSNTAIPDRCIWNIGSYGEYTVITNKYSSKYLYSYGNTINTSDIVKDNSKPQVILTRAWRIISDSRYGNGSSCVTREVTANTSITQTSIKVGKSKTPIISKYYSNEIWCSASDFTYSGYSSIISIDSLTGVISAKRTGNTTVTAVHKVTERTKTFTVNVTELLIYQTENTYYQDENGNCAEDLDCNDMLEDELCSLEWISASDFDGETVASRRETWESMCTTIFSTGEMENVVLDMIDHFMNGSEEPYSNSMLTQKAFEHDSTQAYISAVESKLSVLLNTYDGDIGALEYSAHTRESNPFVLALKGTSQPVFNTYDDTTNGLRICINGLWGNKIDVTSFELEGNSYTYNLHYTLYDHFGLDRADIETYGYLAGFRAWYVLQHFKDYHGAYRPFLTLMEFDVSVSGTYS